MAVPPAESPSRRHYASIRTGGAARGQGMRELLQFYFFIYSGGPERDMLGSINWCFGGVATALAVVCRVLNVGGVVRYVF
jgi:hypothetical protein